MKIPITVPNVFAAFFSLANLEIFRDIPTLGGKSPSWLNTEAPFRWYFDKLEELESDLCLEGDSLGVPTFPFAAHFVDEDSSLKLWAFVVPSLFEIKLESYQRSLSTWLSYCQLNSINSDPFSINIVVLTLHTMSFCLLHHHDVFLVQLHLSHPWLISMFWHQVSMTLCAPKQLCIL